MEKNIAKAWPVFILPTIIAFIISFVFPFLLGLVLSFCDFTTIVDATWNGFDNYIQAFQDPIFIHSFLFSAAFTGLTLVIINVAAFALALILTRNIPGRNAYRTIFFLPNLIGGIVLGYIWQLLINGILANYGKTLALNQMYGFYGLVVMVCWQQIGYMMVIYISAIQAVSTDQIEAAKIDGANTTQIIFRIILPNCSASITVGTFLTLTNGFKLFDQNLSLTAGQPARMSEMLALNIYNTFYGRTGFEGVGQAKAVLFTILVSALALAQLYFSNKKEVEA